MSNVLATACVGDIGESMLRRHGPLPVRIGHRTVWRRADLNPSLDELRESHPGVTGNTWDYAVVRVSLPWAN